MRSRGRLLPTSCATDKTSFLCFSPVIPFGWSRVYSSILLLGVSLNPYRDEALVGTTTASPPTWVGEECDAEQSARQQPRTASRFVFMYLKGRSCYHPCLGSTKGTAVGFKGLGGMDTPAAVQSAHSMGDEMRRMELPTSSTPSLGT